MKSILLALALLGATTLGRAQTAPPAPAASGTKNVGADRADAPQAPGMQQPGAARPRRSPGAKDSPKPRARRPAVPASPAPRS